MIVERTPRKPQSLVALKQLWKTSPPLTAIGVAIPCLFLTFMFGPTDWLLYMIVRRVKS